VTDRADLRDAADQMLNTEDIEGVLHSTFYERNHHPSPKRTRADKPSHYKVICISMYTRDLQQLDAMVDSLKSRGLTKANRSALIRFALNELDLERVPQGL
jgi:hypothetical protein